MQKKPKVLLIGDVCVDVTLTPPSEENKMRLGGIVHAARALWAIDADYEIAYIAPSYLTEHIERYTSIHGAQSAHHIGTIKGSPNVILIAEATEAGNQGYEMLLRDTWSCDLDSEKLQSVLSNSSITDVVIFPGSFDISKILNICAESHANFHIDIANTIEDISVLNLLNKPFETVILSTSSPLFLDTYSGSISHLCKSLLGDICNNFLFKENRGGSRYFEAGKVENPLLVDAQLRRIVHSVGVGDCYNVTFITLQYRMAKRIALTYASWIAADYASTTYPEDFKQSAQRTLSIREEQIIEIDGVSLPWERRAKYNIYIAAPDFDYIDRSSIDQIAQSLRYHNFKPRLPIRENGQLEPNASKHRQQSIFAADMKMLSECQLLLAIIINDDPGTLIEIGLAAGMKMPVIVYDPYKLARNPMLTQLPTVISSSLDEVIAGVFTELAKKDRR